MVELKINIFHLPLYFIKIHNNETKVSILQSEIKYKLIILILIVLRKENINKKYLKCQAFTFAD